MEWVEYKKLQDIFILNVLFFFLCVNPDPDPDPRDPDFGKSQNPDPNIIEDKNRI